LPRFDLTTGAGTGLEPKVRCSKGPNVPFDPDIVGGGGVWE